MTKLLIVDVQHDFVEGGSLGCAGGKAVAERIGTWLDAGGAEDYEEVVASRDYHEEGHSNGGHISDEPDFVDTWPAHCIQGTDGADYAFDTRHVDTHVVKGMGVPAYSALEGYDDMSEEPFTVDGSDDWHVVGIATDYCVKQSVMDLLARGCTVTVLADMVAPVTAEGGERALEEMRDAGADIR